jgi:hypothetical protein
MAFESYTKSAFRKHPKPTVYEAQDDVRHPTVFKRAHETLFKRVQCADKAGDQTSPSLANVHHLLCFAHVFWHSTDKIRVAANLFASSVRDSHGKERGVHAASLHELECQPLFALTPPNLKMKRRKHGAASRRQ